MTAPSGSVKPIESFETVLKQMAYTAGLKWLAALKQIMNQLPNFLANKVGRESR